MPPLLGYCGFSPCGGGFTVQASLIRYRTGRPAGQLNGAHMGDETVWAPLSALTLCGPVATDETIRNKIGKALEALAAGVLIMTRAGASHPRLPRPPAPTPAHQGGITIMTRTTTQRASRRGFLRRH